MSLKEQLEYTNISEYRIGDTECENLVLKALKCGVDTIVISPSSLEMVSDMLRQEPQIRVCVSVAYPSGAYPKEAKVQEIKDLLEMNCKIDGFYATMQVGAYLSGKKEEVRQEMYALTEAAGSIPVRLITELGVLSEEQIEEICRMAIDAGIDALVTSTGFLPYDVPTAGEKEYQTAVKAAERKLKIIVNGDISTRQEAEKLLALGVDKICTTKAYEILK